MMRHLLIMITLCCTLICNAQSQADSTRLAIEQINRIKLDTDNYLYAEVTMNDWLEAYNSAKSLLKEQLSSWLVKNYKEGDIPSYIARSDEHIFEIKALRGNRYRAFVYIKKSDIIPFLDNRQLVTVTADEVKDKAIEETLFKMPSEEEKQDTVLVHNGNLKEDAETDEIKASVASVSAKIHSAIEDQMLSIHSFGEIEEFITDQQKHGTITTFGKYVSRPQSGTYYMFVYNRDAEIPAYLRCDDNGITNLKTGQPDTMTAYKNCGAIWFK